MKSEIKKGINYHIKNSIYGFPYERVLFNIDANQKSKYIE